MFFSLHIIVSLSLIYMLWRNTLRYTLHRSKHGVSGDIDAMPSVTICIPARNEDHALQDCLSGVIAANYPKLEVIVLDDCSQDQTSQIIRSFAHDGVRFIQTQELPEGWLGKNYAYQSLLEQAHGEYVVFMSVDTRIAPHTVTELIEYMKSQNLAMTSVLPQRGHAYLASTLFAPLRVLWQLISPFAAQESVGTALWAVRRKDMVESDIFASLRSTVFPERKIARHFAEKNIYRFLGVQPSLGVQYEKKWSSQLHTSTRLWSPLLEHKIMRIIAVVLFHAGLFVAPTAVVIYSVLFAQHLLFIACVAALLPVVLLVRYLRILGLSWAVSLAGIFLPLYLGLQECALVLYSWYRYRRGVVEWRGRNVCYPRRFRTPD